MELVTQTTPDIVLVQETRLRPHRRFNISGFVTHRRDRHHDTVGGVAIFIRTELAHYYPLEPEQVEMEGVTIVVPTPKVI